MTFAPTPGDMASREGHVLVIQSLLIRVATDLLRPDVLVPIKAVGDVTADSFADFIRVVLLADLSKPFVKLSL